MVRGKYLVSPRAMVKYGGQMRGEVKFGTRKGATDFIKKRRLKGAILYKKK